jgi:hypothetical protein
MISNGLEVWQVAPESRLVEKMPDGSTAVFDTLTKTVHSINTTAAAAFEACREKRTLPQVATAMREVLDCPVTEDMALAAISELERAGLVACSGSTRRSILKAVGTAAAAATPVVLSLSSAEQSAYAQGAGSGLPASIDGDDSNAFCTNRSFQQGLDIAGHNTHFSSSSVVTFDVPWITVNNVNAVSATLLLVSVTVGAGAPSGTGQFGATVKTGSETVKGTNIFFYNPC